MEDSQSLNVSGEAGETNVQFIVYLEYPLEVRRDCLKVHTKSPIAGYCEAVLPDHRHHRAPVVLEDLK